MTPTLPAQPRGTPAWLIRLASLLLLCAGPALDIWNPGGKLTTSAVQAAVILVFLLAGFVLFTIHVVLGAVHEYGWSKKAAVDVESQELAELRAMFPEFKATYAEAAPALKQLPDYANIAERLGELEHAASQKAAEVDLPTLAGQVKTLLAADAAGLSPAPAAPADSAGITVPAVAAPATA